MVKYVKKEIRLFLVFGISVIWKFVLIDLIIFYEVIVRSD